MSQDHPTEDQGFLDRLIAAYEVHRGVLNPDQQQGIRMIFSDLSGNNQAVSQNYDIVAPFYDDLLNFMGYQAPVKLTETVSQFLDLQDSNLSIFDAGAGTGLLGVDLRKAGFRGKLVGVDISAESIQYIQSYRSGIYNQVTVGDLTDLSEIPDASFDAVLSAAVIGLAPQESLDEILRVTKSQGLIAYSFNQNRYDSDISWKNKHELLTNQNLWQNIEGYPDKHIFYANQDLGISSYFYIFSFCKC
ncbi:MAG: class I SAM-dependent methyltransferase [Okeania sp. SIO2C2]|uniref:class I SAM-dependent DNA methyltransferase n=1 Tax=Okeania sp. SIO2C2 TaxID=2607787 RepID=UPI0013B72A99|nr:class I SAM-dependent methyltransferase [Okeania sp. SIO2C2]NEP86342.1 class I SAM-dependent methyltransferase [Okeania sp. SIO2C2]